MLKKRKKLITKFLIAAMCTSLMPSTIAFADETKTTSAEVTSTASTTGAAVSISTDTTEAEGKQLHPLGCIPDSEEKIASMPKAKHIMHYKAVELPSSVDLSRNLPKPGNQGTQGSCTAWATAYAYKSFQEKLDHNWDLNTDKHLFSPAYVYNQLNVGDKGCYISDALALLQTQGCCSLDDMPYNADDYTTQPNESQTKAAAGHKALSDSYLGYGSVSQMKDYLANNDVIIVSTPVYPDFDNISNSNQIYDVDTGARRGYHAICFVGYDDSKQAFKFINSWGTGWGLDGYGYMSYDLVSKFGTPSYVMTDIDEVSVTDVTLNSTSLNMVLGNTSTLTATVLPSDASDNTVKWSSSNTNVATVSSSGVVTGVAGGSTIITCTSINDGCKSATCRVTVEGESDFAFDSTTGTITKCNVLDTTVVIPRTIIGVSVKIIGNDAFQDCSSLTSITIPDSITSIGNGAFTNCSSLTSITVPDSITSIGNGAFTNCSNLTSITIPDSITSIENGTFTNCTSLTSIIIPDSVKSIKDSAFNGCSKLTGIIIPDSITSIENGTFTNCSSLTSITIPDSVKSIKDSAFDGCSKLTRITIPDDITSIGNAIFANCTSLTDVTIPDSVTIIGNSTFANCSSLTSITIPDGVKSIKNGTFDGCSKLTRITIPDDITSIGNSTFANCTSLTEITIPDSVTSIGNSTFANCSSLTSITIPTIVTSIGYGTFANCSSLTSITIPDGVKSIKDGAFGGCSKLTSITIPDSVTSIGVGSFSGCSSLASITIPTSVTRIGSYAFHSCTNATFYVKSETTKQLLINSGIDKSKIILEGSIK